MLLFPRIVLTLIASHSFRHVVPAAIPSADADAIVEARGTTYPSASGRLFNINGKTQYFSGEHKKNQYPISVDLDLGVNAWWLGHLFTTSNVDQAMSQISGSGYKVARVWAFGTTNVAATETNVYYQVLNSSGQYFNYNANDGIARLDYVVSKAESLGLKLTMTLLNNFDALGGINTYNTAFGGTHNSFYTDAASQNAYKKYIQFIVNRYKTSPAIFSWELCNEPRCSGCATSVITNWATTISQYIKSLDSNHMVALGDEGWLTPSFVGGDGTYAYSGYEGVDFVKNLAIKTLDYGTVHMYPDQWGYNYTWGNTWITQHNAVGKAAGKPVMMEEYAAPSAALRAQYMPQWQNTILKSTSLAADMVWQFASSFADGTNPYDNYAIYYNSTAGSEFQTLGAAQAKAMLAKTPTATI